MEELDLKELFMMFWTKMAQIILIILIFMVLGIAYSYFFQTPSYKASTKLVLTQSAVNTEDESITQADLMLNSKLVPTYGALIKTNNVLSEVVTNINNPEITIGSIKNNVSVKSVEDTELIEISVTNNNPNYAATIANEIATLASSPNDKAIKTSDAKKSITFVIISPIIDFL